jgi:hypothetical protein
MISTTVEGNVHRKAMRDDEVATQADWNIMIQCSSGKQKFVLIERGRAARKQTKRNLWKFVTDMKQHGDWKRSEFRCKHEKRSRAHTRRMASMANN